MSSKKPLLVLTDFDGTLSLTDVGYEVLLKFSGKGWDDIDRDYCEGRIGSLEAYGRICAILDGNREDMLRFVAENTVVDPHFGEFYAFCRERGSTSRSFPTDWTSTSISSSGGTGSRRSPSTRTS